MRVVSLELAGSLGKVKSHFFSIGGEEWSIAFLPMNTVKKARQNEAIHLFLLRKRKIHRFIKQTRPGDCTLDSKRRG
jgi:hypothetical protein